ncbi:MAG TPA: nucleoside kinase [Pseudobacteroides sp.]|uniref:nucleoside kinase n=1 Tax=Pseudobacteroides sp. TaxID=1968840 RepID=UPI002F91DFD0
MKEHDLKMVRVGFKNGSERLVAEGVSLEELAKDYEKDYKYPIFAAKVNNDIKELNYIITDNCDLEFLDLTDEDGMRIYRRSLHFILIKAVHDLFPERKLVICHTISKGIYCELKGEKPLDQGEVTLIEKRMWELVNANIPFVKRIMSRDDAKELFKKSGRLDRYRAVEHRRKPYVTMYNCDDLDDYFYGYMAPGTGHIKKFALKFYAPGLILMYPDKRDPSKMPEFEEQKKLFSIFKEYKKWGSILGVNNAGDINNIIMEGQINTLIRVSEALHEKKIAQIADLITNSENKKRVVLISGPSSSGKTTFAQRLSVQLRVNGLKPVTVSLDDYFVDREHTPKDEMGDYDFEALEAIDVELFNQQLSELISGKEVEVPIFNFTKGCRDDVGRKLKIDDDQLIIIEGIHGLNEKLTSLIPKERKFKIYVSALTSLSIDEHNRIPTTDSRLIRRIVRDFQFRGSTAASTLQRWPSVRRGEEKNIFPYQEEADIMFNSALVYELGVLKVLAEPLLAEIGSMSSEYSEAKRLIEFLGNFLPVDTKEIPLNSIIKEFLGGSCFC